MPLPTAQAVFLRSLNAILPTPLNETDVVGDVLMEAVCLYASVIGRVEAAKNLRLMAQQLEAKNG